MKIGTNYENKGLLINRLKEENNNVYAHVNKEFTDKERRVNYWIDVTNMIVYDEKEEIADCEISDLAYCDDIFFVKIINNNFYVLATFF